MKTLKLIAISALIVAASVQAKAQQGVQDAIDRLVGHPKAKVEHSVSYDRSPIAAAQGTGGLTSMLEVYNFTMKAKQLKLVEDIVEAMIAERNNPACYRIENYAASALQQPRAWDLVYGEDAANKVEIGRNRNYSYTFVNIADQTPEAQGRYRTCYCIEWREWDRKIYGRIIITYARIPDATLAIPTKSYSATMEQLGMGGLVNGAPALADSLGEGTLQILSNGKLGWAFGLFTSGEPLVLINALRMALIDGDADEQYAIAPLLYKVIKDAVANDLLTDEEREMLSGQLKSMISPGAASLDANARATQDYLRLAAKILQKK